VGVSNHQDRGGSNFCTRRSPDRRSAKTYTAPWTVKITQSLVLDSELIDYYCLENEKDFAHMVGKEAAAPKER
jgi:hypothetical protein